MKTTIIIILLSISLYILLYIVLTINTNVVECKRKKINLEKLNEEWKDEEEDDDWHEDTMEWKKKMHTKHTKPIKVEDIPKMKRDDIVAMTQQGSNSGGMAMTFAQLKPGTCDVRDCTEKLAIKWTDLLVLGGVQIKPYAVEDDQILITQEDNNVQQLKEFIFLLLMK